LFGRLPNERKRPALGLLKGKFRGGGGKTAFLEQEEKVLPDIPLLQGRKTWHEQEKKKKCERERQYFLQTYSELKKENREKDCEKKGAMCPRCFQKKR